MKRIKSFIVLLLTFTTTIVSMFSPLFVSPAFAEQKCGTDLYNGKITDCYLVGPANATVISNAGANVGQDWYCGPLRQCFAFERYGGTCGTDNYTDSSGKEHITYCSVSRFGRESAPAYRGCATGETCIVGAEVGTQSCNWIQDSGDGRIKFCFGGFPDASTLRASKIEFQCVSNCGGAISGLFSTNATQTYNLGGNPIGDADDGKFSCVEMDFDTSVKEAINWQVQTTNAACAVGEIAAIGVLTYASGGLLSGAIAPASFGVGAISLGAAQGIGSGLYAVGQVIRGAVQAATVLSVDVGLAHVGGGICNGIFNNFSPRIQARVIQGNGTMACLKEISVHVNETTGEAQAAEEQTPFNLCQQAGRDSAKCEACFGSNGIWTAVGCIPYNSSVGMIRVFITIGLGIAGGVVVLMVLAGAFLLSTSQGDPKRVDEAKGLIGSAVIGLLFVIFSVTILRFVGVDILQIPGLGGI